MTQRKRFHSNAIYYFDSVYRCGTIREAARQLHVASSAVSRQILKLEDELGVPLFERLPRGLKLTSAGEVYARHVRTVLQDTERTYSELDALQNLFKGHVEIVCVESPAFDLIPDLLSRLNKRYPEVTVGLSIVGSKVIPEAIINGDPDFGLAFDLHYSKDLQQLLAEPFRLGAIMSPDHPLANKNEISLASCMQYPLIMGKSELSIHQYLEPMLSQTHAAIESSSIEFSRQLARRGLGIAFQTRIGISEDIQQGTLVHVPVTNRKPLYSELGVYARAQRHLPVAADFFARELCDDIIRLASLDRGE